MRLKKQIGEMSLQDEFVMTHLLCMTKLSTGNQPQTDRTGNPGIETKVSMLALISEGG